MVIVVIALSSLFVHVRASRGKEGSSDHRYVFPHLLGKWTFLDALTGNNISKILLS